MIDLDVAARLKEARAQRYETTQEASAALGMKYPTYAGHENGSRGFKQSSAQRYAEFFRVNLEWLLAGRGPMQGKATDTVNVPLISSTTAGKLEHRQGVRSAEVERFITMSGLGKGDWIALEVDGDSMDRVAPDGSIIFVNRDETTPVEGKPYVFEDADRNDSTFKLYSDDFLMPFSFNPLHRPIRVPEGGIRVIGRVRNVFMGVP